MLDMPEILADHVCIEGDIPRLPILEYNWSGHLRVRISPEEPVISPEVIAILVSGGIKVTKSPSTNTPLPVHTAPPPPTSNNPPRNQGIFFAPQGQPHTPTATSSPAQNNPPGNFGTAFAPPGQQTTLTAPSPGSNNPPRNYGTSFASQGQPLTLVTSSPAQSNPPRNNGTSFVQQVPQPTRSAAPLAQAVAATQVVQDVETDMDMEMDKDEDSYTTKNVDMKDAFSPKEIVRPKKKRALAQIHIERAHQVTKPVRQSCTYNVCRRHARRTLQPAVKRARYLVLSF